jgi:hypothetical protein
MSMCNEICILSLSLFVWGLGLVGLLGGLGSGVWGLILCLCFEAWSSS